MTRLTEWLAFVPTYQKALDYVFNSGLRADLDSLLEYHKETFDHMLRVGFLSGFITYSVRSSADKIFDMTVAGLLHDIGKLRIPLSILNKRERLSDKEFEVMKQHPKLGVEIVKQYITKSDILTAIRQHHELADGSGYYGDVDISCMSERIRIADIWDATTVDRCYRAGLSEQTALRILHEGVANPMGVLELEQTRKLCNMWLDLMLPEEIPS